MDLSELFWNASVEEICRGYIYESSSDEYVCLVCGENFTKGIIYPNGKILLEAERAVKSHIAEEHGSVFEYLLNMDKKYTGLTDVQKKLLGYFFKGINDKEIVELEGEGSTSTIRNYRFKFKEREKQSKIFLALMTLLNDSDKNQFHADNSKLVEVHRGATMIDDRYVTTEEEKEKILKNYIKNDKLTNIPSSEKKKIIILQYLIKKFDTKIKYSEKEVNEIIKELFDDYVTLRRYLIQYGFMRRTNDCSEYWVNF